MCILYDTTCFMTDDAVWYNKWPRDTLQGGLLGHLMPQGDDKVSCVSIFLNLFRFFFLFFEGIFNLS
jgi:hypothetical protein